MSTQNALYGRDPALLRRINAAATLREIHGSEVLTLTELVARTGLSRRTAEAVLEDLLRAGWVEDQPPPAQGRGVGRPARRFRFRHDAGYAMGVDVDTQRVRAVLTDLAGETVATADRACHASAPRRERLDALTGVATEALAAAGVAQDRLEAVTVGTPGLVLPDGTVTICQVLEDWSGFSLADALTDGFPCEVHVENDVNLAALGERWRGVCRDVDHTVWVQTGRRTRVAIVIGGQLYRGSDGAAGEVGWVTDLGWDTVRDHPLSATGSGRSHVSDDFRRTLEAATVGDTEALALVDSYGRALSHGLAAVVLTLNPTCLVLGGGAALAGPVLADAVRRHLEPICLKTPAIETSRLGEEAVLAGAVRTSLDFVESRLFAVT